MVEFLFALVTFLIAFPVIFFIVFYILQKKLFHRKKMVSIGVTADVTTVFLFFSVPASVYAFWELNILNYLLIAALLIGISFTVVEWKTQKEVIIMPLLRKIWRFLFLLLTALYIGTFVGGAVQSILRYMS